VKKIALLPNLIVMAGVWMAVFAGPEVLHADEWDAELQALQDSMEQKAEAPVPIAQMPVQKVVRPVPTAAVEVVDTDSKIVGLAAAETARIAQLETRIAGLERTIKFLDDRVRNMDRAVDDLKRRR